MDPTACIATPANFPETAMNLRPLRLLIPVFATFLLFACKAEKVEVKLDGQAIVNAANGTPGWVDFEAVVGEKYTTVDEEKRTLINSVSEKILSYFPDVDVDSNIGADEYEIEIEGTLALSAAIPEAGAPWYVSAVKAADGEGILVQLLPSKTYGSFDNEIENLNSMLGPDEFQPVEFRFTAQSGTVITGGAIVDGRPTGIQRIPMTGQTIKLLFKDGIWEDISGSFLYLP